MGPLPPPAATRQGAPVGRRARDTWTATLEYVQKTLHLGAMLLATQDSQNEYARDKRPGLLILHSNSFSATLQRSRPKPQQPNLLAPRYASMLYFCRPRAVHFVNTALRVLSPHKDNTNNNSNNSHKNGKHSGNRTSALTISIECELHTCVYIRGFAKNYANELIFQNPKIVNSLPVRVLKGSDPIPGMIL